MNESKKIFFCRKINQTEIREVSEAFKKLVEMPPNKLKNLRNLQKIIPQVLSELKAKIAD